MIGAVIGNYEIVQQLGEGGMGIVYLGQHTLLGRRAAIKVLLPMLSTRPEIVNRFFNEARAATRISDPGIVQVFDFGYHTDGSAFIVMEFLEGEPLERRLARCHRLAVSDAMRLCRQIASSLAAAHAQHIIHRDLKPENIFLVRDGEVASGERSKILDFGIAKLSDDPGKVKTCTGVLMGTPVYMSPEQCRGLAEIDHRSDIYALGCVLFHLLTGRPPFEGNGVGDIIAAHIHEPALAPSSLAPEIASNVDTLVLRCLAKAPADRYQSMGELAAAIGQILPCLRSPESPTPPGAQATPPFGTSPTTTITLGTGASQTASTMLPTRSSKVGWWIAVVALLGVAGAAIKVAPNRDDGVTRMTAPSHDAGTAVISPTVDATVTPMAAFDASGSEASPADAAVADAVPADASADAAPEKRSPHPRSTTPHTGPTAADPSGCVRSIDPDCDGIPDVR